MRSLRRRGFLGLAGGVLALQRSSVGSARGQTRTPAEALLDEGFEQYQVGAYPEGWVVNGNSDQQVVDGPTASGSRALELSGESGGCWEAIANVDTGLPNHRTIRIEGKVYPTSDAEVGCHDHRARVAYGTSAESWSAGDTRTFLRFNADDTITGHGLELGSYEVNAWNSFSIRYERDGDDVRVDYTINGSHRGEAVVEAQPYEDDLRYLTLHSGEFTVYWDDLYVAAEDGRTPEISREDVEIEFTNKFETEQPDGFLESLFDDVQAAFPIDSPDQPDSDSAYIHLDVRVEFDESVADSVTAVRPVFDVEGYDEPPQTFREALLGEHEELAETEPGRFEWTNFRIRSRTQVGIGLLEVAALLLSAGMSAGEVTNPIEARTEAYPDVYLSGLELELSSGESAHVDVHERLPRYDDVCTANEFSGIVNDGCQPGNSLGRYGSGTVVFSPATVAIEDDQGRITGRVWENGEYVTYDEIPGATYSGPIRHEFVLAPAGDHRVLVDGQREGTATIQMDQVHEDGIRTERYEDVTVDESTRVERSAATGSVTVDRTRDGTADEELTPDETSEQAADRVLEERLEAAVPEPTDRESDPTPRRDRRPRSDGDGSRIEGPISRLLEILSRLQELLGIR